ncbi:MAG: MFS transporter [Rickettsiales bacterium]|jgi:MFS family permease|nr:MFS transporter [Rickettsiales bacterium]
MKLIDDKEWKGFLIRAYIYVVFKFSLVFALFLPLILEKSLSPIYIFYFYIVNQITKIILEIPTGSLADRFGEKKCLIVAQILQMIGILIFVIKIDETTAIVVGIIFGLADTILTGPDIVYNNLKHYGREDYFTIFNRRSNAIINFIFAALGISTSLVLKFFGNYNTMIWTEFVIACIALIALFGITDHKQRNENIQKLNTNLFKIIKQAFKYTLKHRSISYMLFRNCISYIVVTKVVGTYNSVLYKDITNNENMVGYLFFFDAMSAALFGYWMSIKDRKISTKWALLLYIITDLLLLVAIVVYKFPFSYLLIIVFWWQGIIAYPVYYAKQQSMIPLKIRSTVASIESFIRAIISIPVLYYFSYLSEQYSYYYGFLFVSIFGFVMLGIVTALMLRDKHIMKN